MYMRLWWKDARQFWPIGAFLALAAGVTQLLVHHYASPEYRANMLGSLAMGWAFLYAFAVSAAAFAGERETGTLRLLDLLPASRGVVWTGKVSFAIVTTAALALFLLAMAALDAPSDLSPWRMRFGGGPLEAAALMLQALAWGLFCSAVLNSALFAAVAAILLTAVSQLLLASRFQRPVEGLTAELTLTLGLLVASLIVFAWGRYGRYGRLGLRLRSPIEVTWAGSPRAGAGRTRQPIEAPAIAAASVSTPIAATVVAPGTAPGRIVGSALWSADQPRPRSWFAELRSLIRQTMREGRATWLLLLAIGLVCPAILLLAVNPYQYLNSPIPFLCNASIALLAGVSLFGLENRRRTYRFLVHHGARPGLVWLAKLMTWGFGLALIWAPLAYLVTQEPDSAFPRAAEQWTLLALGLPMGFAVAVLCGMAFPRGITAGVVALILSLALAGAQIGLLFAGMLPLWGLAVLPAALLVVTWIWSGDWLLDRPAPGRWVRLGLILSGTLAVVFASYTGWRAWSMPDVGPIPTPSAWAAASAPLPPDRNAAELYREAANDPRVHDLVAGRGLPEPTPAFLDLVRRGAARPECRFLEPDRLNLLNQGSLPPMGSIAHMVSMDIGKRITEGDLAAAWDEIVVLFRMARHVSQGATMIQGLTALAIEQQALDRAVEWAGAPGQTPERLRAALAAYLALPRLTPAPDVIRAEGILVERTIRLPATDLEDWFVELNGWNTPSRPVPLWGMLWLDMISTPWERTRAVRTTRSLVSELAQLAALEPRLRLGARLDIFGPQPARAADRSPLAELLMPNIGAYLNVEDRNEAGRRALVQVMAVRDWQLGHGGRFPDKLDDLVPDELPSLPLDPYTGRPFGFTTFALVKARRSKESPNHNWPPETRLIYSAGLDGRDDGGLFRTHYLETPGDIVFPIIPRDNRPQTPK